VGFYERCGFVIAEQAKKAATTMLMTKPLVDTR
jgi:hypothetical protein